MLEFVDNRLPEDEIPEIWETEEEKKLSIGQLKYAYLQYAKQNFQGHEYLNKSAGRLIRVSQDGVMEWWRKSRRREHIISMKMLAHFLEAAIYKETEPDKQNRPEIESISHFETECKVNGKPYTLLITTRKPVDNIDKLRYYTLHEIQVGTK
jgi:hypothetical protein